MTRSRKLPPAPAACKRSEKRTRKTVGGKADEAGPACLRQNGSRRTAACSSPSATRTRKGTSKRPNVVDYDTLTLDQLKIRLASTEEKMEACVERSLRLKLRIAERTKSRDRVMAENEVSSLEQTLAANAVDPSELVRFEMTAAERAYDGPSDDRKEMLKHRQKVQMRARELEKAKNTFLEEHKKRVVDARNLALAVRGKAGNAVTEAENDYKIEKENLRSYERDRMLLADAIERVRKGGKGGHCGGKVLPSLPPSIVGSKSGNDRKARRVRYPIDDCLLTDPRAFTYQPAWLDEELSSRKTKLLNISDNLILVGGRALGTKAPSCDELESMIYLTSHKGRSIRLRSLYQSVMALLIMEDVGREATTARKYWGRLVSDGCWPEVVRRFILLRHLSEDSPDHQRPDRHVLPAACALGHEAVESLTPDQHLLMLHYLCDNVMTDSRLYRNAVSDREQANTVDRKKIQELISKPRTKERDERVKELEKRLLEKPDNRVPIGLDRYYRRYWWGLGGIKSEILIEDTHDYIAVVSSEDMLNELLRSLDLRGCRERLLHENIQNLKGDILHGIKRKQMATEEQESTEDSWVEEVQPLRQSSRQTKQVQFFDPSKSKNIFTRDPMTPNTRKPKKKLYVQYMDQLSIISHLPESVLVSIADTILVLVELGRDAAMYGIPYASNLSVGTDWEPFYSTVTTFGFRYGSEEYKSASLEHIVNTLRAQTLVLEDALNTKSKSLQGIKEISNDPTDHDACVDRVPSTLSDAGRDAKKTPETLDNADHTGKTLGYAFNLPWKAEQRGLMLQQTSGLQQIDILAPPAPKRNPKQSVYLWNRQRERTSWLADMANSQKISASRLNYAARMLHMQASPLLSKLKDLASS